MRHWKYKLRRCMAPLLAMLLAAGWVLGVPGGVPQSAPDGGPGIALAAEAAGAAKPAAQPFAQKLVRGHWSEKPEVMRSNHQALLRYGMENGARSTTRWEEATIERCVTCHIVRDEQGQPLSAADAKHFCRDCHTKERVSINCFSCHASLPATDPAIMGAGVRNADTLKARLQQWQKHQQGGAKK